MDFLIMYITSLRLKDFRNIVNEQINLGPGINVLVGKNAQGKTNIIEALGLLATGRSFRTPEFRDMIRRDSENADIRASVSSKKGNNELRVTIDLSRKDFFRNSKKAGPGGFDGVNVVLFAPEEIILLRDSPSARRHYIDILISQLDPSYKSVIRRYERVVSHRNRLLKEGFGHSLNGEIKVWNDQLAELGAHVVVARAKWCEGLNSFIPSKYAAIAPVDAPVTFCYRPHCGGDEIKNGEAAVAGAITEGLLQRRQDELERGITLVGPHRDDLEAQIGGVALKHFGSQGQHRSFVLALKLAEMDLLHDVKGEVPILLLDDVASELDTDRNTFLFNYLSHYEGQIFITATDANELRLVGQATAKRFEVLDGRVLAIYR